MANELTPEQREKLTHDESAAVAQVHRLSDVVIAALTQTTPSGEDDAVRWDIAILACIDASTRIIRAIRGLDLKPACKELSRIVEDISRAESGEGSAE